MLLKSYIKYLHISVLISEVVMSALDILYKKIPFYTPAEIRLYRSDDFLRIRETLTRIGIGSFSKKTLWQMCHIFHEKGHYFIMHYSEMMMLHGKDVTITLDDLMKRNSVTKLLVQWKLCSYTVNPGDCSDQMLRIIPYEEKSSWKLLSKYQQLVDNKK